MENIIAYVETVREMAGLPTPSAEEVRKEQARA